MTTIDQLVGIVAQQKEIVVRVGNGSLDPVAVKRALQDIVESKFNSRICAVLIGCGHTMLVDSQHLSAAWQAPEWYVCPQCQLERARQLWPGRELPEPPAVFTPRTKSEVLLLHVPDTFYSLWDKALAPSKDGVRYTKYRWEGFKADKRNLRLAPNKREYTEPVWLAFDPERGRGERPDSFWGQADLAASEVFSALIQFPEWSLAWFNGASAPNLSGYQLEDNGSWSLVPSLRRWDGDRRLMLHGFLADRISDLRSSPSVREC